MAAKSRAPEFGSRPPLRKRLGQHHLRHGAQCRPLIDFLAPTGHLVIEVGPGGGVLTRELAAAGSRVIAVELDPAWGFLLRQQQEPGGVRIVVGDIFDLDWSHLPRGSLVTGNLPFSISTAVIESLLPWGDRILRLGFLVQSEVADRVLATPGTPAYGAFSVLVAAYSQPTFLAPVSRGSFRPAPKVDGAFVGLKLVPPPLPANEMSALLSTVRLAFAQRRKQLRNALASGWGRREADRVIGEAGVDPRSRAQDLTLADFLALHERLHGSGTASAREGRGRPEC